MDSERAELEERQRAAGMSVSAVARWWRVHHPVLEAVPDDVWPDRADEIAALVDRMVDPPSPELHEARAVAASSIAEDKAAAGRPVVTIDEAGNVVHRMPESRRSEPTAAVDLIEGVVGRDGAAALVGVSTSTWRRWRTGRTSPSASNAERLATVADTVAQLRHSFTPVGVVAWFDRPRPQLDGQRPAELLDDPAQRARLVTLASGSRGSIAT